MKKIVMLILTVFLTIPLGCKTSQTPVTGAVISYPPPVGEGYYAPDIMFVDMKGRMHHLASFYRDATIIAFVDGDCLEQSNPHLISIASKLRSTVSVVEICSPDTESEYGKQCKILRGIKEKNLISICDGAAKARTLYKVTTPTAIFVLDKMGIIRATGTIKEIEELARKANMIVTEEEKRREMLYDGF